MVEILCNSDYGLVVVCNNSYSQPKIRIAGHLSRPRMNETVIVNVLVIKITWQCFFLSDCGFAAYEVKCYAV